MHTHLKSTISDSFKLQILKRGRLAQIPHPAALLLSPGYPKASQKLTFTSSPAHRPSSPTSTHHRTVHIPKCSLLTVKDLPLYLVSLLVNPVNVIGYLKATVLRTVISNIKCVQPLSPPLPPIKIMQKNLLISKGTYFACASACIKINSHFRAKARCSLAKLS